MFNLRYWDGLCRVNLYLFKVKSFPLSVLFKKLFNSKLRQIYALQIDVKGLFVCFFQKLWEGMLLPFQWQTVFLDLI